MIKQIADCNRHSLGFLPKPKVEEAVANNRVVVVKTSEEKVLGFVIFRHRKTDKQTTLSDICVDENWRNQGLGTLLLQFLYDECLNLQRDFVQLKCPVDLPANAFYDRLGFVKHSTEEGRSRKLNIWRLAISGVKEL